MLKSFYAIENEGNWTQTVYSNETKVTKSIEKRVEANAKRK